MDRERLEKLNFLADVAEAVLVEGLTQQEAAERFGLSRPSISRLLAEAREEGLVRVEILRVAEERPDIADRLVRAFGLANAYVRVTPKRAQNGDIGSFSRFAADRVADHLEDGSLLGITLGRTIGALVYQLAEREPMQISVVQLCGSVGEADPRLDSHALVSHLGRAFGVSCLHLHAPYAVETRQMRDMLNSNPSNRLCLEQGRKADVALVGIGAINAAGSSLLQGGHVSEETLLGFRENGAIGDIGGYYIDADGVLVRSEDSRFWRTGLGPQEFRRIKHRIGVAYGLEKALAIAASLRGGWVTDIVTDAETAEKVLSLQEGKAAH